GVAARARDINPDQVGEPEFLLDPQWSALEEGRKAFRSVVEIGLEQPLELEQGLVVEAHVVELFGADAGFPQTVGDGVARESMVVLLAGEALFLRRRDDLAVDEKARGGVVVEGGDSEDTCHVFRSGSSGA